MMKDSLLFSALVMLGDNEEFNKLSIKYLFDMEVNECQFWVYIKLIALIDEGHTYEELIQFIDNLDLEVYKKLSAEKQDFIRKDAKNILALRKE